jgi:hypothetical protein
MESSLRKIGPNPLRRDFFNTIGSVNGPFAGPYSNDADAPEADSRDDAGQCIILLPRDWLFQPPNVS